MFSVLYIASYTLLEPGSILGPEVSGQFFIRWTETFSVCAPFLGGWSFAAHLCYWLQRFFLKFWSIPSLKCQCTNNNRHSLCPHSPHSHRFSLKIFVFWELFNDFCWGVLVGWYWYICKFATLVGIVFDHYIRVVCWHFPICIIVITIIIIIIIVIIIIIIIIISSIVPSFLLTNAWMFHFVLKKKHGYNHKNILKVKRLNLTSLFPWHWCPLWLTFLSSLEIHSLCTFFQLYLSQPVLWQGHSDDQKVVKW